MINRSDIVVTVTKDEKAYKSDTVVEAKLEVHSVVTVSHYEPKMIDYAKENVKDGVWHHIYGDLRDPLEEMYALAMRTMPYGPEMRKVEEAKKRIDAIMRGGT